MGLGGRDSLVVRGIQALGEPGWVDEDVGLDVGPKQRKSLLLCDPCRQELAPARDQGVQRLPGGRGSRPHRPLDIRGEALHHLCVPVARMGQYVATAGEVK